MRLRRPADLMRALRIRSRTRRAMAARKRAIVQGSLIVERPETPLLETALIIPAYGNQETLNHLLEQAQALHCFAEVIVVDDASPVPLVAPRARLIRRDSNGGAGAARNTGLDAATAPYLLFFDQDDVLTDDLPLLLADLRQAAPFDACLFKHADSRIMAKGRWGQPISDEEKWDAAGLAEGTLQEAPVTAWPLLAQTQNYPWNKIVRRDFLIGSGIKCGTTRVHNDLALHWRIFARASRILVSDRICAVHEVAETGLTASRGAERLDLFTALSDVADEVSALGPDWHRALGDFAAGAIDWTRTRLDPDHLEPFEQAAKGFQAKFQDFRS